MPVTVQDVEDPALWADLFTCDVDEQPVQFVKPADTDRPTWAAYDGGTYLGTVSAEVDGGRPLWRVQTTHEAHRDLDDAVRALRRPASWPREREQVAAWAKRLLADETLAAVDVESTGLDGSVAVQIAVVEPDGTVVFNELVNPEGTMIEPGAIRLHKITPERVKDAPTIGELLPRLARALHGRTVAAYNKDFDYGVLTRTLTRSLGSVEAATAWLDQCRWHDVMEPYAVFKGLWSAKRGAYRFQPLGGPHDAVADARLVFERLRQVAVTMSAARW
ncbi:3'-5' exonuclease [Streptomyces sp. NPDC048324]|uniref:3'-5' exonuclease n=1 Tax=Streptomyces sp. NPDC048324 TaxID=3157205 RepID=UPI0034287598